MIVMTLISISIIAAAVIYLAYNAISLANFGIPHSLSMTYYLWNEKDGRGWLFCLMMYIVVALMMPAWITMSEGSDFQFLAFLAPAALLFVGTAPRFLAGGTERRVHETSAYAAAACSLAWVILVTPYWWTIPAWLVLVAAVALRTRSVTRSLVYWLETIAFGSTFTSAILYSLQ